MTTNSTSDVWTAKQMGASLAIQWLDAIKIASAAVFHVEPPLTERNIAFSIFAQVAIGNQRADLMIESDRSHEANLWGFIIKGRQITIFQLDIEYVEHGR